MRVVATAGHVDHGKSTLVQALTGVDPDRLPEEKARGLTIDLGFASASLPSGEEVGFVDVPGHARFVANMLAGVGAADACLFVVAATEGWKEQSEEHLRILELLGLSHGLIAITKVGLVEDGWAEMVGLEVQERVVGTFLAGAEVIEVDVPSGRGVHDLQTGLDRALASTPAALDRGRPRLWIDRSFVISGAGTVVTGTLRDGSISVGDELVTQPGGSGSRVRGLQSHSRSIEAAGPGRRLAVNLTGASRHQSGRGRALVRPGQWHTTRCFDAQLSALASLRHPVERRGAYTIHLGTGEFPARIRLLGTGQIEPGESAPARCWLAAGSDVPLLPGDRFVLRESGRFETVGGGVVLDVEPVVRASRAQPTVSTARVVRERGWVEADHLARLTGDRIEPTVGRWVVDPVAFSVERSALVTRVRDAGPAGLQLAGLDDHQRALLGTLDGVTVHDHAAVAVEHQSDDLGADASRVLDQLERGRWSPPTLPLSDRGALRQLQKAGLAVEAGDAWFATTAVKDAAVAMRRLLADRPDGFTVSDARDALGSSRRHVLPLLTHLDSIAVTRRRGDVRTAGPRLEQFLARDSR